jgi:hypothetical protein
LVLGDIIDPVNGQRIPGATPNQTLGTSRTFDAGCTSWTRQTLNAGSTHRASCASSSANAVVSQSPDICANIWAIGEYKKLPTKSISCQFCNRLQII